MNAITRLTIEGTRLRPVPGRANVWQSGNGRFRAVLTHPAWPGRHPTLWTMTERRGGRKYRHSTATLAEHQTEITRELLWEARCIDDGDRPHRMPP